MVVRKVAGHWFPQELLDIVQDWICSAESIDAVIEAMAWELD